MGLNKEMLILIGSAIISIILTNLGLLIINERKYFGIITILIAFVFLYITYYANQINANTKNIKELKEEIVKKEELLNTLREILILKKVGKIK